MAPGDKVLKKDEPQKKAPQPPERVAAPFVAPPSIDPMAPLSPAQVLQLQGTLGNQGVQGLLQARPGPMPFQPWGTGGDVGIVARLQQEAAEKKSAEQAARQKKEAAQRRYWLEERRKMGDLGVPGNAERALALGEHLGDTIDGSQASYDKLAANLRRQNALQQDQQAAYNEALRFRQWTLVTKTDADGNVSVVTEFGGVKPLEQMEPADREAFLAAKEKVKELGASDHVLRMGGYDPYWWAKNNDTSTRDEAKSMHLDAWLATRRLREMNERQNDEDALQYLLNKQALLDELPTRRAAEQSISELLQGEARDAFKIQRARQARADFLAEWERTHTGWDALGHVATGAAKGLSDLVVQPVSWVRDTGYNIYRGGNFAGWWGGEVDLSPMNYWSDMNKDIAADITAGGSGLGSYAFHVGTQVLNILPYTKLASVGATVGMGFMAKGFIDTTRLAYEGRGAEALQSLGGMVGSVGGSYLMEGGWTSLGLERGTLGGSFLGGGGRGRGPGRDITAELLAPTHFDPNRPLHDVELTPTNLPKPGEFVPPWQQPGKPYSSAHVYGVPYVIGPDTPPIVSRFLTETLSNNRYASFEHLQSRAEAFYGNIEAEKSVLASTRRALDDIHSPEFRQSAHMAQLQLELWARPGLINPEVLAATGMTEAEFRAQLAREVMDPSLAHDSKTSPFRPGAVEVPEAARSVFAMMMRGERGPLSVEQAKFGIELAASGQLVAHELAKANFSTVGQERLDYRKANRVNANRQDGRWPPPPPDAAYLADTHSNKTLEGMALQDDRMTVLNDEYGLTVMSGTSGTSSDAVLSTVYAAQKLNNDWVAPGLTRSQATAAMTDLAFYYMREQVVPRSMVGQLQGPRTQLGLPPMNVDPANVFVHSYAEVLAGVELTLKGKGTDVHATDYAAQNALLRMLEFGWNY